MPAESRSWTLVVDFMDIVRKPTTREDSLNVLLAISKNRLRQEKLEGVIRKAKRAAARRMERRAETAAQGKRHRSTQEPGDEARKIIISEFAKDLDDAERSIHGQYRNQRQNSERSAYISRIYNSLVLRSRG